MWKQYFQFSQSYNTLKEQSHMTLKGEGDLKVTFKRQKKMTQCLSGKEQESQVYQAELIIHS